MSSPPWRCCWRRLAYVMSYQVTQRTHRRPDGARRTVLRRALLVTGIGTLRDDPRPRCRACGLRSCTHLCCRRGYSFSRPHCCSSWRASPLFGRARWPPGSIRCRHYALNVGSGWLPAQPAPRTHPLRVLSVRGGAETPIVPRTPAAHATRPFESYTFARTPGSGTSRSSRQPPKASSATDERMRYFRMTAAGRFIDAGDTW